ncbi:unnamed protein product [Trypanosoma congolense IL3000]|uniref:WGS project CAEQ00000000 data, annotated contig 2051 n=1 Tax=Trypanosoma congolense (strain IL3000) TaxID=1068625 RepID=F9WB24_TRYCI|nr:unnamed protein product [Trypanosoma congolense IL3000]
MSEKVFLVSLFLAWVVLVFPVVSGLGSTYYPKSIPTDAGESICSLSRKLKDVAPWTVGQVAALKKKRDEYVSKFTDSKLHFHESLGCGGNESLLDSIRTALEKVNEEIKTLPAKAIRAGVLAAKSAGRLDEFIMVFANANGGHRYCLGSGGHPAKRRDLYDCFPECKKFEIGEKT